MKLFCLLQVKCLLSPLLKHACTNLSGNVPALRSICLLLRAFRLVVHSIGIWLRVLPIALKSATRRPYQFCFPSSLCLMSLYTEGSRRLSFSALNEATLQFLHQ